MYFDSLLENVILIVVIVVILSLLNFRLNHLAREFSKYSPKKTLEMNELLDSFKNENNLEVSLYAMNTYYYSEGYRAKNNAIFLSERNYNSSFTALARFTYFLVMSKVRLEHPKKFTFQNILDPFLLMFDVISHSLIILGLLMQNNVCIIIGLVFLIISFILTLINLKVVRLYYKTALDVLNNNLANQSESNVIKAIYRYDICLYIIKPLLAILILFPFLLSVNQKNLTYKDKSYGK